MDNVFTTTSDDGFEIETNIQPEVAPATEQAEPAIEAAPADGESDDARERDANGRFAAKAEESAEGDDAKAEPAKVAKPRNDPEARIQQAIAKQREAERKAADAERRAQDAERRVAPPREEPKAAAQPERFQRFEEWLGKNPEASHDDYLDARDEWRDQRQQQAARQAESQRARTVIESKVRTSFDAAIKADPDFLSACADDVLSLPHFGNLAPGEKPTVWHVIGEEVARADNPALLIRYLSDHPDDFQRLATLPPRDITRALAIYETRVDAAPTRSAPTPAVSHAKPPVQRVTGAPVISGADDPPGDDASYDAHARYWNGVDRKARAGRH